MKKNKNKKRIVVGITGASGVIIGIELTRYLKKQKNIETYLILSETAKQIISYEIDENIDLKKLADYYIDNNDLDAQLSSGSFDIHAMVICPTTMKTLSAIAHGYSNNLITRTASVCLKQRKTLVLVPREMPLNLINIDNMRIVAENNAIIIPPMLTFYHKPKTIDDMINFVVGRILDILNIKNNKYKRWEQ